MTLQERERRAVDRPAGASDGEPVDLSVVVPCLNEEETLGELLDSLAAQSWSGSWELILADNGSTDGSVEVAEGYRGRFPAFRVVDVSDWPGQAPACNRAVEVARGASVTFVDADDVAASGWLAALGDALREHRFVASRHDHVKLNPPGEARLRGAVQSAGLQRLWYSPHVPHAGSGGMGIRRTLFLDAGGFDEDLPVLFDTDLCIRLHRRGVELRFVEDACIHVRLRADARDTFRQARRWARYNTLMHRRYRTESPDTGAAWMAFLGGWGSVLRHLRDAWLRPGPRRTFLAWTAGWQVGLLEGALRWRVAPVAKGRSRNESSSPTRRGVTGRTPA